jgi:hypothetical protein
MKEEEFMTDIDYLAALEKASATPRDEIAVYAC